MGTRYACRWDARVLSAMPESETEAVCTILEVFVELILVLDGTRGGQEI